MNSPAWARTDRQPTISARQWSILWPLLLCLHFFIFYLLSLSPTVLWGDDAYFQYSAFAGSLRADGSGHWLWFQVAQWFLHFPWGDVAYRTNLLSAVAATATLGMLYASARAIGLPVAGAAATVISLGVGHTFWMHAVRAEVYTLFTFLFTLILWLWFRWQRQNLAPLVLSVALFGVTLLGHQMAVFLIPGLATLLWYRRGWLDRRGWLVLTIAFLGGMVPLLLVLHLQIGRVLDVDLLTTLRLYFTHANVDFSDRMFAFSFASLPRDLAIWLAYLGLQYLGIALLLGVIGIPSLWKPFTAPLWRLLFIIYLANTIFAINYRVNDQFVFFLPSYIAFAFFVGYGWQTVVARFPAWRSLAPLLLAALWIGPVAGYYAAASLTSALQINPLGIRELPGRDPYWFFLWPAKNGYWGAAEYGHDTLSGLPLNAYVIADHTPLETLRYHQIVLRMRPDVTLIGIEPGEDLSLVTAQIPPDAPIFLADNNPTYYNLARLPDARVEPIGNLYRLSLLR